MEHVDRELVVVLAVGDLGGRSDDRVGLVGVEQPEVLVHLRASAFEQTERPDLRALEPAARNWEVLHRSLCLRAPQRILGYPDLTHGVVLDTVFVCVSGLLDGSVGHGSLTN